MFMKNVAKEKILNNELCLGVGLRQSRTVDIGKIMATSGYDWLFIDMEHNSMDIDIASQISVAAHEQQLKFGMQCQYPYCYVPYQ